MRRLSLAAILAAMAALSFGQSKQYPVMVGDPAPPIVVSKWVVGEPIKAFEKGHVYVLDFWATWCGPCKRSIPHLAQLNEKYKDRATFIGFDVWEQKPEGVEPFIAKRGDMKYGVALDLVEPGNTDPQKARQWAHKHGHMSQEWLAATGRDKIGIPETFIIDQEGRVAWIGDPSEIEKPLDQILAGSFDLKESATAYAAQMSRFEEGSEIAKTFDDDLEKKDYPAAIAVCEKLITLDPDFFEDYAVQKYVVMAVNQGRAEDAAAYGRTLINGGLHDPDEFYSLALTILDPETKFETRDYDLAIGAAQKAIETTQGSKSYYYNALAKIYFAKGEKEKANQALTDGIALATPDEKEMLEKTLASLQQGSR